MNPPPPQLWVPGLVSVTFRQLAPDAIVALCVRHGLQGIEWGGDVHCPPTELAKARRVAAAMRGGGLECAAYGSYYRAGEAGQVDFARVVETAEVLCAPVIRVWAGAKGSAEADAGYRARVTEDLKWVAGLAAAAGKVVSLEYHAHTLTDTVDSIQELLRAGPGLAVHWQPSPGLNATENLAALEALLPRLSNLHVFAWEHTRADLARLPLAAHRGRWEQYFRLAASRPGRRFALLEFVRDDDPAQLAADAQTLRALLG